MPREVRYLGLGPNGVVCSERYEEVFGSLLTEMHPTKTIEVKGEHVAGAAMGDVLVWLGPLRTEISRATRSSEGHPRSETRRFGSNKSTNGEYPLFAEIDRQENDERDDETVRGLRWSM